jgi:hypothetical protein
MAVAVSADEEAVIKKRLLTQTTVARVNADPPLKRLTKRCLTARSRARHTPLCSLADLQCAVRRRFMALCAAAEQGQPSETSALHAQFLRELELFEFQARHAARRAALRPLARHALTRASAHLRHSCHAQPL